MTTKSEFGSQDGVNSCTYVIVQDISEVKKAKTKKYD